jgi:hypothetical protein
MAEKASSQGARRLSFIEDPSQSIDGSDRRPKQETGPPNTNERRKSIWNTASRKSIYQPNSRRLSHSFSHGSRKSSQDLPRVRLQNTYRTEPNENERFQPYKVEPKIYELLQNELKDKTYDPFKSAALSKELSQDVMRETRLLMNNSSPRYKLVTHVVIGEIQGQDIRFGSRCLWDQKLDNLVSVVYKNSSLYAIATVFAVYFE